MKWLLAFAVAVGVAVAPGAASAQDPRADHRPCVSLREFRSTSLGFSVINVPGIKGTALTLHELEMRWDVVGHRVDVYPYGVRRHVIQYQACGFSPEDVAVYVVIVDHGGLPMRQQLVEQDVRNWLGDSPPPPTEAP